MGKTTLTKEQQEAVAIRRDMKRRQYNADKAWIKSIWQDGIDELSDSGLRDIGGDERDEGEPVHPGEQTDVSGDKGQ